jgi:hypothetical protein
MRALAWLTLGTVLFAGAQQASDRPLNKAQGDQFQSKLARIVEVGNTPPAKSKSRAAQSTEISDAEVNAYLRFHAKDDIPAGIVDPSLQALGDGRIGGRAIVDLDAVRKQKPRGWLDPMGYITGRVPITARGRLTTQNGVGQFTLEGAELAGVAVPKVFVQELLSFYSRTSEKPEGINMDDPFPLPAQIREIKVAPGRATIVQ